ncbi:substrate-binding domain-containing protein [Achromobacter sp. Marseille-Q0513]|uniref:substrate-binding domain-containing protein n=1 Tax=Achromobacter sp. Marseille-Q0513 TaxID=2829161 RepID=UPI001B9C97A2|nr:substrate-binding domain-containing protein [Achromobacter sp. Marseille-Q0513]MBR8654485.1 substrate-binding domain-containing protein [Achromobacter sp. Marseille-Q0513]
MFNRNSLVAALSAAGLMALSGAALAQQVVVSGGATLPAPLYNDEITSFPASTFKPYVGVGSGAGKTAFLTNNASGLYSSGVVHWIGSESILTQAQINDYLITGLGRLDMPTGHGPLIQIPAMVTPITISYKGPTDVVQLTKGQLCGVLSGKFDKWSDIGVSSGTAPDRFKVIYRKDDSGTTQLLTRHLQAVCGPDANVAFTGKSVFAEEFPTWFGQPQLPPQFIGVNGSAGVAAQADLEPSVITYLGPDPAHTSKLRQAELFNINDFEPWVSYAPTAENVESAMASTVASLPTATGPVERDPRRANWTNSLNQANPFNWIRASVNPRTGYPIVGYTSFVLSQCYENASVTSAIKDFLTKHYSASNDKPAQHLLVPLGRVNRMRILSAFVTGTIANLNVGNATVCGNYAGRG